jgi:hypothetical protein
MMESFTVEGKRKTYPAMMSAALDAWPSGAAEPVAEAIDGLVNAAVMPEFEISEDDNVRVIVLATPDTGGYHRLGVEVFVTLAPPKPPTD